jgi:hypothetical protein
MRVGDTHYLAPGAGRIGERAEDVHHGGNPELPAHRPHMPHGRMHQWGEHEDDPRFTQRGHHLVHSRLDAHA